MLPRQKSSGDPPRAIYHTRAIISRGLYIFYPISKDHLCTVIFGLIYGLYSRAAFNQERLMMARVRYLVGTFFAISYSKLALSTPADSKIDLNMDKYLTTFTQS